MCFRFKKLVSLLVFGVLIFAESGAEEIKEQDYVKQAVKILLEQNETTTSEFYTVGGGAECDFVKLQNALAAIQQSSVTEIRLANTGSPYSEALEIQGVNVQIIGGYANCADAEAGILSNVNSVLQGTGGHMVNIINGVNHSSVTIKNVDLNRNGLSGSAIYIDEANVDMFVENSLINYGVSFANPAVVVYEGQANLILKDVSVQNNTVTSFDTAGVFCQGGNSSVMMFGNSDISFNKGERGTALQAWGYCDITVFSPSVIQANTVGFDAGGVVLASDGGRINLLGYETCEQGICFGQNSTPVKVINNQREIYDDMGTGIRSLGIHAEYANSKILGVNVVIADNNYLTNQKYPELSGPKAFHTNVSAIDHAVIQLETKYPKSCWSPGKCTVVSGAQELIRGDSSSDITLVNTYVGIKDTVKRPVLFENGSSLTVLGSNMRQEAGESNDCTLYSKSNSSMKLISSSFYFVEGDSDSDDVLCAFDGGYVKLDSTLFLVDGENSREYFFDSGQVDIRCSMMSSLGSIVGQPNVNVTQSLNLEEDPFIDVSNGNMHLRPDSPANDFCLFPVEESLDMDGDQRGYDNPLLSNLYGPFDIGSDESIDSDIIFKDGFSY